MKVWIIRENETKLMLCFEKPKRSQNDRWSVHQWEYISFKLFPEIKPGECYSAVIELGEKE